VYPSAVARIHHLQCGTLCPIARRLVNGDGGLLEAGRMICHCLLVETDADGLILVDSGFGTADCTTKGRIPGAFGAIVRPAFDVAETAVEQVKALGFSPDEVRHVVVTHLDLDHAGGLGDFPKAKVHLHGMELRAALARATLAEKARYISAQWAHGPDWSPYDELGERWFGLEACRPLTGVRHEIALIPLFGHSRGHSAVAVRDDDRWLLHAGDAYFFHGEMEPSPRCPAGLAIFQRLAAFDDRRRRDNQARLREMVNASPAVRVFSAHDPVELERLQGVAA
jgi:glyoxylase-like metal-dependent hydrolase (beta-lactamase superfamily II)